MQIARPLLFLLMLLLSPGALAVAKPLSPINLHHTSWTAKDGAPSAIIAIAQTPDRWLWLASTIGLYRFDGVSFERFHPSGEQLGGSDIWGMRLLGDGALWIGYRSGGASRIVAGAVRNFGSADGFTTFSIMDFEQDWRGHVWAASTGGLRMFDGTRWHSPGQDVTGHQGPCTLLADRQKNLWAQCEAGVFVLKAGSMAFVRQPGPRALGRMAVGHDGTVWSMGGPSGEMVALAGPGKDKPLPAWPRPRFAGGTMMFERDGAHAWVTRGNGVARIGPGEIGREFGPANGLSGSLPNCVLQDAEGNVWIGTENGVDRFRPALLAGVALPQAFTDSPAIAAERDGGLWVGSTLVRSPGPDAFAALPAEGKSTAATAIYRENADSLWIGALDGLWRYQGGKRSRVTLPEYANIMQFHSMARDSDGGVWVSMRGAGTIRLHDGVWQRGGGHAQLAPRANWIHADRRGRIWFGYSDGEVNVLDGRQVRRYGSGDGLRVGSIVQILDSKDGVWVTGLNGMAHFDGERFVPLLGAGDEAFPGVSGMVDVGGAWWMNGAGGITVVQQNDIARALADPRHRVPFRRLDHKDGLRGIATNVFPMPSAVAGSDGMLWFATSAGLFWLDPQRVARNGLPPPVLLKQVEADGAAHALGSATVSLPARAERLQFSYTALSLAMPERMQFLYRLDGVDRNWQQGGAARVATYTDLAPGEYRFRVKAANNDGVWSEQDAEAAIRIEPAFHQTTWFRVLAAAAALLALWGVYKLRVAQVARQVAGRFEARLQERERIARDLHDTLLQTFQALLLQMQTAWHKLPHDEPARGGIERSLDLAQAALQEGRDKVCGLRATCTAEGGADLVAEVCNAIRAEHPSAPLSAIVSGTPQALAPEVFDELRAIALEALRNAVRHAGASCVVFEVSYGEDRLVAAVRDNGCGMPAGVLASGARSGHWGLVGMRERAERIGATLSFDSKAGEGTVTTVSYRWR